MKRRKFWASIEKKKAKRTLSCTNINEASWPNTDCHAQRGTHRTNFEVRCLTYDAALACIVACVAPPAIPAAMRGVSTRPQQHTRTGSSFEYVIDAFVLNGRALLVRSCTNRSCNGLSARTGNIRQVFRGGYRMIGGICRPKIGFTTH